VVFGVEAGAGGKNGVLTGAKRLYTNTRHTNNKRDNESASSQHYYFMTPDSGSAFKAKGPAPELITVLEGLSPGKALDLAAGSGRHAIWLADRGWEVTAVDIDVPDDAPPGVVWIQADLELACVEFLGDLVVCWLYWDADLLPAIRYGVRRGGVVALAGKTSGRFATSLAAYREAFAGWEELSAGEDEVKAWFIARKC
jgi:hypothetical protein